MNQLSLLPEPPFFPLMPPRGSRAEKALFDLLDRDLTTPEWDDEGNGWRLPASVKELDYLGWEPISTPVDRIGSRRPIARYSLPEKAKQFLASMRQGGDHA